MDRLAAHPFETLKHFLGNASRKDFKWVGQPDELMIDKRNFRNALYDLLRKLKYSTAAGAAPPTPKHAKGGGHGAADPPSITQGKSTSGPLESRPPIPR